MDETNPFEKHRLYIKQDNKIVGVNPNAIEFSEEAFSLFKSLYDTGYGSIDEHDNLISIHTGGWSENEYLISQFKETGWWFKHHKITARGGHYYFNTDIHAEKEWHIEPK